MPHTATVFRVIVVLGLLVIAGVHLNLYARESYNQIPTISWLFLLTVIVAFTLALVMGLKPHPLPALVSAGFAFGVLGGYLLTLFLPDGLFLFKEPGISYSGAISIFAEVVTAAAALWIVERCLSQRSLAFRPQGPGRS